MAWAIEDAPPMPAQLVATLVGLANHADKGGKAAYPSMATLSAYTCKSERSVRRDLRQLEELGLIRAGDPDVVKHLPADRRPEVYDLCMERVVAGGRAGNDEGTRASARTLASSRARGGKKKASSDEARADVDVRADADVRADVDVTDGRTPTSQRADAHVTDGGTPTSAKPSLEPSLNRPQNQEGAEAVLDHLPRTGPDDDPLAPIDLDGGFTVTDGLRRWAHRDGYAAIVDIDYEAAQFVSHFRATGQSRRNWNDEFQKWVRRSAKFAAERASKPTQGAFLMAVEGGGEGAPDRRRTAPASGYKPWTNPTDPSVYSNGW